MMELPKAFIISTVVYVITRIVRAIGKDSDDSYPIVLLGFVAGCIMAFSGVTYLLELL